MRNYVFCLQFRLKSSCIFWCWWTCQNYYNNLLFCHHWLHSLPRGFECNHSSIYARSSDAYSKYMQVNYSLYELNLTKKYILPTVYIYEIILILVSTNCNDVFRGCIIWFNDTTRMNNCGFNTIKPAFEWI